MEPIKKETIEWADDFFFRLSEKQLAEKVAEFKRRQPNIYRYMVSPETKMSGAQQKDIFWRIVLVLDYCFNSYPIVMPRYTNEMGVKVFNDTMKLQADLEKRGVPEVPIEEWIAELEQDELFEYFSNKISFYYDDISLFNDRDHIEMLYCTFFTSKSYQREVRKLMKNHLPE